MRRKVLAYSIAVPLISILILTGNYWALGGIHSFADCCKVIVLTIAAIISIHKFLMIQKVKKDIEEFNDKVDKYTKL